MIEIIVLKKDFLTSNYGNCYDCALIRAVKRYSKFKELIPGAGGYTLDLWKDKSHQNLVKSYKIINNQELVDTYKNPKRIIVQLEERK